MALKAMLAERFGIEHATLEVECHACVDDHTPCTNGHRAWFLAALSVELHESPDRSEGSTMDGKKDDLDGRAKEAAGDLTDNDDLKREGKVDQATGKVKEKVGEAADKVRDKVKDLTD